MNKDEKQFQVKLDGNLMENFDAITEMTGVTKSSVIKDAVERYVEPFLDNTSGKFSPRKAKLMKTLAPDKHGHMKYTEIPCRILNECIIAGQEYYSVWCEGELMKVPKDHIVL